ncbi:nucleoside-diphosphate kinase [Pseudohyphozyma bogoriensis]|nr:nucleoside-diphosphate kinase [Pseudohyphozyma bogoriensis]
MSLTPQLTLGIIKPSVYASHSAVQDVMNVIKASGLEIVRTKKLFWRPSEAAQFYAEHAGRFYAPRLISHAASGPSLALALYGPSAIKDWRALIGPTHVYKSQWLQPDTLRAKYGLSDTRNGFHGSDSVETALKELGMVFEGWDTKWWLEQRAAAVSSEQS